MASRGNAEVTFDLRSREIQVHQNAAEPWLVTLVDAGVETQTGGRLGGVSSCLASERLVSH